MRMSARFLGWRQTDDTTQSAKEVGFLPLLPIARDPVERPQPRAEWSDADSFHESDGFKISKWRAECDAELKEIEARLGRKRFAKPFAKKIKPSPLNFPATFVQVAHGGMQHLQRGHVDAIQAARESYDKERALRVRQSQTQEGKRRRKLAAEWRDNQEKQVASSPDGVRLSLRPESGSHEDHEAENRPVRHLRREKTLERIRRQETRCSNLFTACSSTGTSPCEKDASDIETPSDFNEIGRTLELRHRIKHVVTSSLEQRRRHARKIYRHRQLLKAKISEMPDATRHIIKNAFDLYSHDHKCDRIAVGDLWKALTFVGLRGPTSHERRAVDDVCIRIAAVLAREYGDFDKGSINTEDASDSDISRPRTDFILDRSFDFEVFCAELVPRVRQEVSELRQDLHFGEFMKVLEDSSSVFLNPMQFKCLTQQLGIDESVLMDSGFCDMSKPRIFKCGRMSSRLKNASDRVLDFEVVHEMLMKLEEQHHNRRHKRELEIKAKLHLTNEEFWKHQGELAVLYDSFLMHDKDKCEYLGFNEVKQLLHCLGLQPYRPREGTCLDKLLKECDADGSETLTFDEFLELITRIRTHQRVMREALLHREFSYFVRKHAGLTMRKGLDEVRKRLSFESTSVLVADDGVDVEKLSELLSAVGFSGCCERERDIVDHLVRTHCGDTIDFQEFQDLCQRICECLSYEEVEEQYADAKVIGIEKPKLFLYQRAFDHARFAGKASAGVSRQELPKILQALLVKPPEEEEVETLVTELFKKNGTNEMSFQMFLEFMNAISIGSKNMLSLHTPFSLKDVPEYKLREILDFFPLATEYIDQVAAIDVPDLVAGFLNVKPDADLKQEFQPPIGNVRQLISYVQKKSSGRREPKPTSKTVSELERGIQEDRLIEHGIQGDRLRENSRPLFDDEVSFN